MAHLALCLNHYLLFMFGWPSPWKLLHVWQRAFWRRAREQPRATERIASSQELAYIQCNHGGELKWAFGSTPGFREQRCEPLMLAAEPAWHPLPFPSSPCHGCLPSLPPSLPCWDCKEDLNKERELFFSSSSAPMTSPLQPPAPRFQTPGTFLLLLSLRPSILTKFLHFIIARPPPCHQIFAVCSDKVRTLRVFFDRMY